MGSGGLDSLLASSNIFELTGRPHEKQEQVLGTWALSPRRLCEHSLGLPRPNLFGIRIPLVFCIHHRVWHKWVLTQPALACIWYQLAQA